MNAIQNRQLQHKGMSKSKFYNKKSTQYQGYLVAMELLSSNLD